MIEIQFNFAFLCRKLGYKNPSLFHTQALKWTELLAFSHKIHFIKGNQTICAGISDSSSVFVANYFQMNEITFL